VYGPRPIAAHPYGLDRPKGLRNKLFSKLEQVIECRFDDKLGTLKTVSNFLGRFNQFYYDDLVNVQVTRARTVLLWGSSRKS
jgi:hypothetical protein